MTKNNARMILLTFLIGLLPVAMAGGKEAPSAAEQMQSLEKMCADSEQARTERQAAESLYNRLGGYERIHDLTTEIVRRHEQNDDIKHMFVEVDGENLAKHVADFMAAGTGGTAEYTGRDMPSAHAKLKITNADFLSAGGDIMGSMQSMGYAQDEIDEVLCILVSLQDQVIME